MDSHQADSNTARPRRSRRARERVVPVPLSSSNLSPPAALPTHEFPEGPTHLKEWCRDYLASILGNLTSKKATIEEVQARLNDLYVSRLHWQVASMSPSSTTPQAVVATRGEEHRHHYLIVEVSLKDSKTPPAPSNVVQGHLRVEAMCSRDVGFNDPAGSYASTTFAASPPLTSPHMSQRATGRLAESTRYSTPSRSSTSGSYPAITNDNSNNNQTSSPPHPRISQTQRRSRATAILSDFFSHMSVSGQWEEEEEEEEATVTLSRLPLDDFGLGTSQHQDLYEEPFSDGTDNNILDDDKSGSFFSPMGTAAHSRAGSGSTVASLPHSPSSTSPTFGKPGSNSSSWPSLMGSRSGSGSFSSVLGDGGAGKVVVKYVEGPSLGEVGDGVESVAELVMSSSQRGTNADAWENGSGGHLTLKDLAFLMEIAQSSAISPVHDAGNCPGVGGRYHNPGTVQTCCCHFFRRLFKAIPRVSALERYTAMDEFVGQDELDRIVSQFEASKVKFQKQLLRTSRLKSDSR